MSIHLTRDLDNVERNLHQMSEMVLRILEQSVETLAHPDPERSRALAHQDDDVDESDVRIEDACLKMLAVHQPVARDLRRIATALKITSELEQVADLGVNIAERAAALASLPAIQIPTRLNRMVERALSMLHRSVASYLDRDIDNARRLRAEDEAVDALNREIIDELQELMRARPDLIEPAMHVFSVCRHVERVADHATNIAEDVIYLVDGAIVRHQTDPLDAARVTA